MRGATKVPEPWRCTEDAALDQILHRLAHGDARNVGLGGDVALGRQRVARPDQAAIDRVLDAFPELQIERRAALRRLSSARRKSGRRPRSSRRLRRFARKSEPPSALRRPAHRRSGGFSSAR